MRAQLFFTIFRLSQFWPIDISCDLEIQERYPLKSHEKGESIVGVTISFSFLEEIFSYTDLKTFHLAFFKFETRL